MIGSITGVVKHKGSNFIILETQGVGYKVAITPLLFAVLKSGQNLSLLTHTYVREDQISLYGFETLPELQFFELLLTVSGVGPKSALGIMSISSLEMIKSAIASGDAGIFTKVSGIGRKTAERVIVELREKMKDESGIMPVALEHSDAVDALVALGYSQQDARSALKKIPPDVTNLQDKVKHALKGLTK